MKYKLYECANNRVENAVQGVLKNRGIEDYEYYLNLDESCLIPYFKLNNIEKGVKLLIKHLVFNNKIGILIDEDPDGFCSAAMMYLYLKKNDNKCSVEYIMHTRSKAHGLSNDVTIPDDIKLLIIPDAGTNDVEECKSLKEKGIDVLILDHHENEKENPYAVIINNQMSDKYENKNLCGAGVVYKFLQALDDELWNEHADDYLDLFALANISDVMDMRSYETRYLTDLGLLNIKNKCLKALINSQEYSMNGKINIHNMQWYITPILNALIRIGTLEEKELLFKAFIENNEFFEYKKRGTKDKPGEVIKESVYDRVARFCKNTKSKQDRQKEKSLKAVTEFINDKKNDDKVIMVDTSEILDKGLTGVVAIKVAEMYNKPCILLNKFFDSSKNRYMYTGSARNVSHRPIDSFKDIVNSTKSFDFGQGHANAFGVGIEIERKDTALEELNNILKNVVYDSTYNVDFILNIEDMNVELIYEMSKFEDIICQGIEPPIIAVTDITLSKNDFEVYGKNEDVISFKINDIKYVQFKCKNGNGLYDWLQDAWSEEDNVTFEIVGTPSINDYNGIRTPQFVIEDVNILHSYKDELEDW